MFFRRDALSPEVHALLERERSIPALPAAVRARAVIRARVARTSHPPAERATVAAPPHTIRWATAAALILLAGVAGGAAAYELGARRQPTIAPAPPVVAVRSVVRTIDRPAALPALPRAPSASRADLAREELHLLERARAAVARGDFEAAMIPLAEHARRFREGRLAEEREALRVTALAELGRSAEARRAIAAFERRFPRSPVLAAVRRMADPLP
jgi:hypothetical protein